jgi:methyl-accepting chemotaxis protein
MFFYQSGQKQRELEALSRTYAVIYFKPDGTILDANENFLSAVGYPLEEIQGRHHSMFCEANYAQSEEYKNFWARLARGEAFTAQFRRFGKGGKEIWIEATYNPILGSDGKTFKVVKYATDITNLKLQLANYEGQLKAIGQSQAVIEFNMDGTIITANENFLMVMGYALSEIEGKHHRMFAEPEYAQSMEYKEFWNRLQRGEFFSSEYKRLGKGGKEVWIQATYNPIKDMNGNLFKVVKFATDITETKRRAADYEGQIKAISKSQAVIEFNLDGTILTANENFLSAMGYTLSEIQGKHHSMFVDTSYAQSAEYKEFWSKLGRGEYLASEYKRFGKGGREVWIQATYNPIMDASGKPRKVVKYATDITKTRQVIVATTAMAEQTSANVQSVAAAVEEMTASIDEIGKSMALSQDAAVAILSTARESSAAAGHLMNSTKAMENIVTLINNIADQVNLLALNATIEAARAGEAGRGFAVVASEVKNLATQASNATEEIAREIQAIQVVSNNVAGGVRGIEAQADDVSRYVSGVASAIEQQSSVTREISANTQVVTNAVQEIAGQVKQLSSLAI